MGLFNVSTQALFCDICLATTQPRTGNLGRRGVCNAGRFFARPRRHHGIQVRNQIGRKQISIRRVRRDLEALVPDPRVGFRETGDLGRVVVGSRHFDGIIRLARTFSRGHHFYIVIVLMHISIHGCDFPSLFRNGSRLSRLHLRGRHNHFGAALDHHSPTKYTSNTKTVHTEPLFPYQSHPKSEDILPPRSSLVQ